MIIPVKHSEWQVLRAVLRAPKGKVVGRDLRIAWTRRDKNCAHLPPLVAAGLLRVVRESPEPADATYELTAAGKHAAEYGEYECDRDHVAVQPPGKK